MIPTFFNIRLPTRFLIIVVLSIPFYLFISNYFSLPKWSYQSENKRRNSSINYAKWIVITSINNPTQQVEKLSQIPDWKLLVVADRKTPANWSYPNTILLNIDIQSKLDYRVLKYLPWNSYTRKVIGYLYAIEHGAQFIYDTDDDNAPNDPKTFESRFAFKKITRGLVLRNDNNETLTNPYVHFGQPSIWPRGYPLEHIGKVSNNSYTACAMRTPLIQQGLVNGDPDVDAIFRLTRKQHNAPLNIQFDGVAPPIILPKSVMSPYNSQNTIFHYDAFWSLILPVSSTFRVTDIWRGYWAQPLLWSIGGHLGFYSPKTTQIRNAHNYLRDYDEEDQLYKQSGELVRLLSNWKCTFVNLYECMVELANVMTEKKFWSRIEIDFMEAWIYDLKDIGYKVPEMKKTNSTPCLKNRPQNFALFSGVNSEALEEQKRRSRLTLQNFCGIDLPGNKQEASSFPSILLVITFNWPYYANIWLLDTIYRPHFPNILYCGQLGNSTLQDQLDSKEFRAARVNSFSFIEANVWKGYFSYECAINAIKMNYGVEGYLVLSDDVLLNFWNIGNFSLNEAWLTPMRHNLNMAKPGGNGNKPMGWGWWNSRYGTKALKRSLRQIYNANMELMMNKHLLQYRQNREEYGYHLNWAWSGLADLFYVPKSKEDMFFRVASIFRKSEVFLEVAVPMILTGLSSPKNIVTLTYIDLWMKRRKPFVWFNTTRTGLHPVKLSRVIKHRVKREAFCHNYIVHV